MSVSPPLDLVRFRIQADPMLVGPLRERFLGDLSQRLSDETQIRGWALTFNELVFNAIYHGAGSRIEEEILVEWCLEENAVRLACEDPGPGPDPGRLSNPQLPEDPLAESGRGLFLLDHFADELRPFRGPCGFRLEVVKHHPGLGRVQRPDPDMDQALEELSTCYESLSLFYRLAQSFHGSADLATFINGALADFIRLHPFHRVFLLAGNQIPATVHRLLQKEPWYLHVDETNRSLSMLASMSEEFVWFKPEDLVSQGVDPKLLNRASSGCVMPVRAHDLHFGSLVALRKSEDRTLNSGSIGTLRTLSDLCGIACANSHLGQLRDQSQNKLGELKVAVEIQKALLPILPAPASNHWKIRIDHQSSLQVAGDYALATTDSNGNLVAAIIDVMGKGVSAALLASIFRSSFELSLDVSSSAKLVQRLNNHLCRQLGDFTMFITCAIARYDVSARSLDFCSAGHCRTLMYAGDRRVLLEPSGPPIGIIPDSTYRSEIFNVSEPTRMIFLTDGCYEWDRSDGTQDGWQHFLDLADSHRHHAPERLWEELMSRITASAGDSLEDDCTLLTLDIPP